MAAVKETLARDIFQTPWGWIGVAYTPRGLRRLVLPKPRRASTARELGPPAGGALTPWPALRNALLAYLDGRGPAPDPPLDLPRAAPLTRRILAALRAVPSGATISYGELARRAGNARAARAAGQVLKHNPVPLVVPCHRVVAATGPGGYAGGAALKKRLLELELRGFRARQR